jgi:HD-like signal output (HDOD) protein
LAAICGSNQEEAYTSGLLHDVGRFGLMIASPKSYAALLRPAPTTPAHLLRWENRQFGIDHCQAGWWLLREWGLPPELAMAAACHHDPPAGEAEDTNDVVVLGCRLATALGFESSPVEEVWTVDRIAACLPQTGTEDPVLHAEVLRDAVEQKLGSVC